MSTIPDLSRADWEKSSYSGGNGGQCVEFSRTYVESEMIPVRDSKLPSGPALVFAAAAWSLFVAGVKGGDFV
ncbi:MAG: DUF397 domain-containing protein [Streptomycetaceae bacterium]|nr:DUF397 domain-containing protein [Streptomycetaceae bacterium]